MYGKLLATHITFFFQRFDKNGNKLGSRVRVNTPTAIGFANENYHLYASWPEVGVLPNGNFVVTWCELDKEGIFLRLFDVNGNKLGSLTHLLFKGTLGYDYDRQPSVGVLPNGNFVITWMKGGSVGDGDGEGILAYLFNADWYPLGGFQVNTYITGDQQRPSVGVLPDGNFVITWENHGNHGISAQVFDANGNKLGEEFQVNIGTGGTCPSVGVFPDGSFMIAWSSSEGIFAKRLRYLPSLLYVEWIDITPSSEVETLKQYNIRISVRNLGSEPDDISLQLDESGCLSTYDDTCTLSQTKSATIAANDNHTFSFPYVHYWRWLKPIESTGPLGTVKFIISNIPDLTAKVSVPAQIVDYLTIHFFAKPENTYTYTFTSTPRFANFQDLSPQNVTVTIPIEKEVYLASSLYQGLEASTVTTITLAASLAPPVAAALAVAEGVMMGLSSTYMNMAADPDQNYQVIVTPETISLPELESVPESYAKDLAEQSLILFSDLKALEGSWTKYLGAKQANDTEWVRKQIIATKFYLGLVKNDYELLKSDMEILVQELEKANITITDADVERAKNQLITEGLPQIEIDVLKRLGFADTEINESRDIAIAVPNEETINYSQTLLQRTEQLYSMIEQVESEITVLEPPCECELSGVGRHPGHLHSSDELTLTARVKNIGEYPVYCQVEWMIIDNNGSTVRTIMSDLFTEEPGKGPARTVKTWTVDLDAGSYRVAGLLHYGATNYSRTDGPVEGGKFTVV